MKTKKRFPPSNNVISLAWSDKVSFEEILMKTGKSENEVIKIMRKELTPNSFKSWRKRVTGRKTKHEAKRNFQLGRFKCSRQKNINQNKISKRNGSKRN